MVPFMQAAATRTIWKFESLSGQPDARDAPGNTCDVTARNDGSQRWHRSEV